MAVSRWNDLSGRECGLAGDGEVGMGAGALRTPGRTHPSGARGDCPAPGDPPPLPSVGLRILS